MNTQNTPVIISKAFFDSNVRTLVIGDNIWLHCGDVAKALGYSDPKQAVQVWIPTRKAISSILHKNSWGGYVTPPRLFNGNWAQ